MTTEIPRRRGAAVKRKTPRERALIAARDTLGPNLPTVLHGLSVGTVARGAFVMGYLAGYRAARRRGKR